MSKHKEEEERIRSSSSSSSLLQPYGAKFTVLNQCTNPMGAQTRWVICCKYGKQLFVLASAQSSSTVNVMELTIIYSDQGNDTSPKISLGEVTTFDVSCENPSAPFHIMSPISDNEKTCLLYSQGILLKVSYENGQVFWKQKILLTAMIVDHRGIVYIGENQMNENEFVGYRLIMVDSQNGNKLKTLNPFTEYFYSLSFDLNSNLIVSGLDNRDYTTVLHVHSNRGSNSRTKSRHIRQYNATSIVLSDWVGKKNYVFGPTASTVHQFDSNFEKEIKVHYTGLSQQINSIYFVENCKYLLLLQIQEFYLLD